MPSERNFSFSLSGVLRTKPEDGHFCGTARFVPLRHMQTQGVLSSFQDEGDVRFVRLRAQAAQVWRLEIDKSLRTFTAANPNRFSDH